MKKSEFEVWVDLPLNSDRWHKTGVTFPHPYEITNDVLDWDADYEVNEEGNLNLRIDNKTVDNIPRYNKQNITINSAVCNKGFYAKQYIKLIKKQDDTDDERWFTGRIENIKKSYDSKGSFISLDCVDLSDALKGEFVTKEYADTEISVIVRDLVDALDISAEYVETTNIVLHICSFLDKSVYECIDELAKQCAFDWYVDAEGRLHFFRSTSHIGEWIVWTKKTEMSVLPDSDGWILLEDYSKDCASISNNILLLDCTDEDAGWYYKIEDVFDAEKGTTFEIKVKINSAVDNGLNVDFADGAYLARLVIQTDKISVKEGFPSDSRTYSMDTTDDYHVFRVTLEGNIQKVFVDGILRIEYLSPPVTVANETLFGDALLGSQFNGEIDYVYYSAEGAFSPETMVFEEGVNLISAEETEDAGSIANQISVKGAGAESEPIFLPHDSATFGLTFGLATVFTVEETAIKAIRFFGCIDSGSDDIIFYLCRVDNNNNPPGDFEINYIMKKTILNSDILDSSYKSEVFLTMDSDEVDKWTSEDESFKMEWDAGNNRAEIIADTTQGDNHPKGHYVERVFDSPQDWENWAAWYFYFKTYDGDYIDMDVAVGLRFKENGRWGPINFYPSITESEYSWWNVSNWRRKKVEAIRLYCGTNKSYEIHFLAPNISKEFGCKDYSFLVEGLEVGSKYALIVTKAESEEGEFRGFKVNFPPSNCYNYTSEKYWDEIVISQGANIIPIYLLPFTCTVNDPEYQFTGVKSKKYVDPSLTDEFTNYAIAWHKLEELRRPRGNISISSLDITPSLLGGLVRFGCDSIGYPSADMQEYRIRSIGIKYSSKGLECDAELSEYRKEEDADLMQTVRNIIMESNKKDKDKGSLAGKELIYWLIDDMNEIDDWVKAGIGDITWNEIQETWNELQQTWDSYSDAVISQEKTNVKYGKASTHVHIDSLPDGRVFEMVKEFDPDNTLMCNWTDRKYLEAWFHPSIECPDYGLIASIRVFDDNNITVFETESLELTANKWTRIMASIEYPKTGLRVAWLKGSINATQTDVDVAHIADDSWDKNLLQPGKVLWIPSLYKGEFVLIKEIVDYDWYVELVVERGYYDSTATSHADTEEVLPVGDKTKIRKLQIQFLNQKGTEITNLDLYIDQISTLRANPDPLLLDFPLEVSP